MCAWLVVVIPQMSHFGCGSKALGSSGPSWEGDPSALGYPPWPSPRPPPRLPGDSAVGRSPPGLAAPGILALMWVCSPLTESQESCWLERVLFRDLACLRGAPLQEGDFEHSVATKMQDCRSQRWAGQGDSL